jgi:hypothetical protein
MSRPWKAAWRPRSTKEVSYTQFHLPFRACPLLAGCSPLIWAPFWYSSVAASFGFGFPSRRWLLSRSQGLRVIVDGRETPTKMLEAPIRHDSAAIGGVKFLPRPIIVKPPCPVVLRVCPSGFGPPCECMADNIWFGHLIASNVRHQCPLPWVNGWKRPSVSVLI